MFYAPLIVLALAGTSDNCDVRATIAGELMFMHQSGASAGTLAMVARSTRMPDFAVRLVARILDADTSRDTDARELAAFHFAAEVYSECELPDPSSVASSPRPGAVDVGAPKSGQGVG